MSNKKPAIMIQGTCSNAGKSILTAALCRIFYEDGFSPAPFKAQNMSLNSFVTPEGCEIGRAQALQAAACGRTAHTHMNPILLKPHSDIGSQVIVMGKAVGHMRVHEYIAYKPTAWQSVIAAYTALANTADIMVIEGAGSPAEINLKQNDIVNMAVAKYVQSPVLLCADIDRGGAFASLVGTMALLDKEEQDLVSGFILNKFRGDSSLLNPAYEAIESMTNKKFFGTIPWINNLDLPDEDSVSFRLYGISNKTLSEDSLDIAIIETPHLSNITDIDSLKVEPDTILRIVRNPDELGTPDMLLLLGSKNTYSDYHHLEKKGLITAIKKAKSSIPFILGICGGLQMLGTKFDDKIGIESGQVQYFDGLNFLPLSSNMHKVKTLNKRNALYTGKLLNSNEPLSIQGYEIHHGQTTTSEHFAPCIVDGETPLGWEIKKENTIVMGTYLHGVLDNDVFRRTLLNTIRIKKGLKPITDISQYTLNKSLDILAKTVRDNLDMDKIYKLLKI